MHSLSQFPFLTTRRLLLREFRQSDAQAVFDIFSQDELTRHHNQSTMRALEEAETLVSARINVFIEGAGIRWAIVLRHQKDRVIGSCGFYNLNKMNSSVEIGYDLHPAYWRQHIMSEALRAAIDFGFSEAGWFPLNRVEALTYLENEASAGLLLKLGFQEEGIRREYGFRRGKFHDLRCFSLLRREWIHRREPANPEAASRDE